MSRKITVDNSTGFLNSDFQLISSQNYQMVINESYDHTVGEIREIPKRDLKITDFFGSHIVEVASMIKHMFEK